MDGVLIDSEPLWRDVELRVLGGLGVPLTEELCMATMGMRVNEAVDYWHAQYPWTGPDPDHVTELIVEGVIDAVRARGRPKPGIPSAIEFLRERGLRLAIASSSYYSVIDAVLDVLDFRNVFAVVHSAEDERNGKPHPAVFLTAAAKLGVAARACVAVEDSVNGVLAAKAADMACIAIPEPGVDASGLAAAGADLVLGSIAELDEAGWHRLLSARR